MVTGPPKAPRHRVAVPVTLPAQRPSDHGCWDVQVMPPLVVARIAPRVNDFVDPTTMQSLVDAQETSLSALTVLAPVWRFHDMPVDVLVPAKIAGQKLYFAGGPLEVTVYPYPTATQPLLQHVTPLSSPTEATCFTLTTHDAPPVVVVTMSAASLVGTADSEYPRAVQSLAEEHETATNGSAPFTVPDIHFAPPSVVVRAPIPVKTQSLAEVHEIAAYWPMPSDTFGKVWNFQVAPPLVVAMTASSGRSAVVLPATQQSELPEHDMLPLVTPPSPFGTV